MATTKTKGTAPAPKSKKSAAKPAAGKKPTAGKKPAARSASPKTKTKKPVVADAEAGTVPPEPVLAEAKPKATPAPVSKSSHSTAEKMTSDKVEAPDIQKPAKRTTAILPITAKKTTAIVPITAEITAAPPKPEVETLDLLEPRKEFKRKAKDSSGIKSLSLSQKEAAESAKEQEKAAGPEAPAPEFYSEETEDGKRIIHLKTSIMVKELAPLMGMRPFEVIKDLMTLQIFAGPTQVLELETVGKLCEIHEFVLEREKKDTSKGYHKPDVKIEEPEAPVAPDPGVLPARAPIVTFMGHVDHGKTSLLDAIRKTRVAAVEKGGITQHIGAYSVDRDGKKVTFLDTPGHAAFTAMRARGANVTDIVVLVVAADDGLMPQTLEAISHAQAAKVQIMVAINKVDLVGANIDRVKSQLQEKGLNPEDWGGDIICCEVSATKGTGVDKLLGLIALQSEILELTADPKVPARCHVIEAQVEQGRGPTATMIVGLGTLRLGDAFICGNHWGKIKQLIDDRGKPVKEAGPASPVKVLGLSGLPNAGDELVVMSSERDARVLSEERLADIRNNKLAAPQRATLENLFDNIAEGQKASMPIILKGDVQGSLEALITALREIPDTKISLGIIHSAVGPITESDVMLASASNAVIIGFSVKVENNAAVVGKREGVQIKLFSIIYELIDQVREAMTGLLEPEVRETVIGHANVKQVFSLTKGRVAGCIVSDGRILRTARARVLRGKQAVYDGGLATLRRFQDEVKEVRAGVECGIKLGDYSDYQPDDIIECYTLENVAQKL
jgi:translation initiation factor IF-2